MHKLIGLLLIVVACRAPGEVLTSPLMDVVRTTLDSTRTEAPLLVRGAAPRTPDGAWAVCYEDHILIMDVAPDVLDYVIAHELVHWYIDDSPYQGLPHFIEEGLADWIACDLTGRLDARKAENEKIGTMSISPTHMSLGVTEWMALPAELTESTQRAGFDLVDRLGLAKLRELAQDDAPPLAYLYTAGVGGVTETGTRREGGDTEWDIAPRAARVRAEIVFFDADENVVGTASVQVDSHGRVSGSTPEGTTNWTIEMSTGPNDEDGS